MTTIFEEIRDAVQDGAPDTALAALVGEVAVSPTANTVLDRLKTIATKLDSLATYTDGLEGLATNLNGFVDGLEALIGTTNASLTSLAGYTDGLEALITTLNSYVDTLEASQTSILAKLSADPATQTTLAALLAKVIAAPSTEAKQDSANNLLSAIGALLTTQAGYLDGIEAGLSPLATQTTLAAVLAKISADPATQTTLAAILAAVTAATPAGSALIGKVAPVDIASATQSNVAGNASSVTLIAANASRKPGSTIANDSTAILYIKLGSTASATDYWVAVDGKTTVPGVASIPDGYLGIVTGIWASATGAARVTEMA